VVSGRRALRAGLIAGILVVALVLRLEAAHRQPYKPINDAGSYLTLASYIARTGDYSLERSPGSGAGGTKGPSAYFAPGFPYYLGLVDLIDGHAVRRGPAIQPARDSQVVLGMVTVALVGLVAFELFGSTAGLIALLLAAVYPVFTEMAGVIAAENLLTPLILAALYTALRSRRAASARARYGWVVGTGVLTGLATLTHENGVLILAGLIPAVWTGRPRLQLRSLAAPALLVALTALMILPWTIRNAVVMHSFIPVSDETGITLVGTYNVASAHSTQLPYKWRIFYGIPGEGPLIKESPHLTEPQLGAKLQSQALHYIEHHPVSLLQVLYHNTRRMFEIEGTFAWIASASAVSLTTPVARTGVISFWILCMLAVAGLATKRGRSAPGWVWVIPVLLALSVIMVNVETPRFREPVDPFLILLAAAGLATAVERVWSRLRRAPVGSEAGHPVAARPAQLVEVRERLA
jgi:4-amino-4-deoxy-L-arabinose transferase-like glycosyltransferase